MTTRAPIATLLVLTPVLTELLSGNLPPFRFFNPAIFGLMVLLYGLPVLAIREFLVRRRLGLAGLFLLGLAYGVFNEGVCAKTLLLNHNVPIPTFDGYAIGSINYAWAICILPWHALHAVLYPILLVTWLFPDRRNIPWVGGKSLFLALLVSGSAGGLAFFGSKNVPPNITYFLLFTAAITLSAALAPRLPPQPALDWNDGKASLRIAILGFFFYPLLIGGLALLAKGRCPTPLLALYAAALLCGTWTLLSRKGWRSVPHLLTFALGDQIAAATMAFICGLQRGAPDMILGSPLLGVFLLMVLRKVIQGNPASIQEPSASTETTPTWQAGNNAP